MADAKTILTKLYNEPDRHRIKKDLWYQILKDIPFGTGTGGVCVVAWGTPGTEAANVIETDLTLTDVSSDTWSETTIVRLTCTAPGTMAIGSGALGTVISGSGTNDMLIETDSSGQFSLAVTDSSAVLVGDIYIMAGATQGSPPLDARTVLTNTFA